MKNLKVSTILILIVSVFLITENSFGEAYEISEGIYKNENDEGGACSVLVKKESTFGKKYTVTVFRKSLNSAIYPDRTVKSDSFSFSKMYQQMSENDGKFSIITKDTLTTEHKVSGRVFVQGGALLWDINASREVCHGYCSSTIASCTVQLN